MSLATLRSPAASAPFSAASPVADRTLAGIVAILVSTICFPLTSRPST